MKNNLRKNKKMTGRNAKIIVTLGPATNSENDLRVIKEKGVDFVRCNMSHSSLADLERFIHLSKKVGIPFIIDTEGSQIRTGGLEVDVLHFDENDKIIIHADEIVGNHKELSLKPGNILTQLEEGDLIHIDFDTLILRVTDTSTVSSGYITTKAITGGFIGKNKAVVIDPVLGRPFDLPHLSPKDFKSIEIGLREGVNHVAVSFVRSGATIDQVRKVSKNKMEIISKIECVDALNNLDEIIQKSDYLLIDRGDLSKEIPLEKIPFSQKIIIDKARDAHTPVFVATNLLETMVEKKMPTRAEVHDVITTIIDGAAGLTLAAETAIGKYPLDCINMLNKLIGHAEIAMNGYRHGSANIGFIKDLADTNYLLDHEISSGLIEPHGGILVNQVMLHLPDEKNLKALPKIHLTQNQLMDVEQLAIGTYSPLTGFMGQEDFKSVLSNMRLTNGLIWPIPIVLDVPMSVSDRLQVGERVALLDNRDEVIAILHLDEKYSFDIKDTALKMYGTDQGRHPGVRMLEQMNPVLLAGEVSLIRRRESATKAYELTPKQLRRLFNDRGWAYVLGFHTRNVIHKGHEFIQLTAMESEHCDGLLVHPVIGKKKPGDFNPQYIIKAYETMLERFYPKNKVVFATFATFSRYAGPREALFTALCRKNFGCSHFVVGRDHTGVGDFYAPDASQKIFDRFPEIGIKPIKFGEVFYSRSDQRYIHQRVGNYPTDLDDRLSISGSQAREMLQEGVMPPEWFMRPEISRILLDAVGNGENVFVEEF
jgi:pyruvate kinase